MLFIYTEPDDADRKKKTSKTKAKGSTPKPGNDSKPNISYPTVNIHHHDVYALKMYPIRMIESFPLKEYEIIYSALLFLFCLHFS